MTGLEEVSAWTADRAAMTRAMAYTWMGGSAVLLTACTLPDGPMEHEPVLALIISVVAFVSAVAMLRLRALPAWAFEPLIAVGTALVTLSIVAGGESTSPFAHFYVWVTIQAFSMLPGPRAAVQVGVVAVLYGAAIVFMPAAEGQAVSFLLVMGAVVATGVFARTLRRRADGLASELLALARRDPLTGLLNRRGLSEMLDGEFDRARTEHRELSLMVLDLDHFKTVNDSLGHAAGDAMLVQTAKALIRCCRSGDLAARTGGDEFVVLLPATGADGATAAARRVRRALEQQPATPAASIGVATFPRHGDDAESLNRAADAALYRAKAQGRGQIATPDEPDVLLEL